MTQSQSQSRARAAGSTHVAIIVSGVPIDLLKWFDMEAFKLDGGKRGGGGRRGSGRSGLIVRAMEAYQSERKRRAAQNRERKAARKNGAEQEEKE